MDIAETQAKRKGLLRKDNITQGFMARQGDLSLRRGENTAHVRMDAINSDHQPLFWFIEKHSTRQQIAEGSSPNLQCG